jgi:four helix bundle protein
MNRIKSFEDLIAWQKARTFNLMIYKISELSLFSKDFALKDQIRRASISIASNIAEGFERNGNKEFIQYLSIAKASNAEVRSQLFMALDLKYIGDQQFEELNNYSVEIGKIIHGLIHYLHNSDFRGSKFMEDQSIYISEINCL